MCKRPYPEGIAWDEAWRQRQRADMAEDAARMLFTGITCHDMNHTPAQYHQSYEPCKARAAFVDKYPFLKDNPNESDQTS